VKDIFFEKKDEKISIIIPVLNESENIEKFLRQLPKYSNQEIIFVDGGSKDKTRETITKNGLKLIKSPVQKRSFQMNLGAKESIGNILLFLHADTILPENYPFLINNILAEKNTVAGAFLLKIDHHKKAFRFLEKMVNWRSHFLSLPYGDQGIFMKKSLFQQVGGFQELAIMEDFDLIKRLQKIGKITIASEAVITSARRWEKLGILKTTLINQLIIIGYYLGIKNQQLANLYRQIKSKTQITKKNE
jgi:rSAM/selenodomain-associated transferase 2